jgi:hypothetical protein
MVEVVLVLNWRVVLVLELLLFELLSVLVLVDEVIIVVHVLVFLR